ncbi:hypothetical protein IEQ34_004731 [Dendrobium chrysotoxum]|uniref:Uncharacterized protein n=1 Tax=Dendrobium chrysotoxum TaxID=161865 RepID=A0AAV7HJ80_DENCH|nr:hypothetical protein IEQ34_004731 [Dendrobium chrysotoxum]
MIFIWLFMMVPPILTGSIATMVIDIARLVSMFCLFAFPVPLLNFGPPFSTTFPNWASIIPAPGAPTTSFPMTRTSAPRPPASIIMLPIPIITLMPSLIFIDNNRRRSYGAVFIDDVQSSITSDSLEMIRKKFYIPNDVLIIAPKRFDRVYAPPLGFIVVYEITFHAGLRFSPAPKLLEIFKECENVGQHRLSCIYKKCANSQIIFKIEFHAGTIRRSSRKMGEKAFSRSCAILVGVWQKSAFLKLAFIFKQEDLI